MKKLEPAPGIDLFYKNLSTILEKKSHPEILAVIEKADAEYLYWDKFKQIYRSTALPPEQAWAYLQFSRNSKLKRIPLKDSKGNNFGYWIPDEFLKWLHYLDQNASGSILVEDPLVPTVQKERFIISSLMEEAIASSQLEGAATTWAVAKEMLKTERKPENNAEQMILNNYVTMKALKQYRDEPLTPQMLFDIQALLVKDTRDDDVAGRFRKSEEEVTVKWNDGTILHVPPPAEELKDRIRLLCDFANAEDHSFIHPVIKAIILHFWLAYDHPFVDGNGRTARALFYWYLLRKGYWLIEFISISRVIKKAPAQYAKAYLYAEAEGEDITYFIHYHLNIIEEAIKELREYLKRKTIEAQEAKIALKKVPDLNARQSQLLYQMITRSFEEVTIQKYKNISGSTYETARTDLMELEHRGLMLKQKRKKQFVYVLSEKVKNKAREI